MLFRIERSPPHQLLARLACSHLSRIIESLSTRLSLPSTRQQEAGKVRSQSVPCETQTPEPGVTGWGAAVQHSELGGRAGWRVRHQPWPGVSERESGERGASSH